MDITSSVFLFFCFTLFIAYYLTPPRFQWATLLAFSIAFFCLVSNWQAFSYVIFQIFASWIGALLIERAQVKYSKKILLIFFISLTSAPLVFLKYSNFFLETTTLSNLFTGDNNFFQLKSLIVPIGISFYSLSMISYIVDVYWGVSAVQPNFFKYSLFCIYFPQIISGPIVRYGQTTPYLFEGCRFSLDNFLFGIQRIGWGFFKKLVISERLAIIVNTIFSDTSSYPGLYIWFAMFLFVLQLYTDFSACMDILLGCSECLGIALPENFRSPIFSKSTQDFWQRWHITLGQWMKDYMFYPLMRSNLWKSFGKILRPIVPKAYSRGIPLYSAMIFLWFYMGLWHGGAWHYIMEGLFFGIIIIFEKITTPYWSSFSEKFSIDMHNFSLNFFKVAWTFMIVSIGLFFFRADSCSMFFDAIKSSFSVFNPYIFWDGSILKFKLTENELYILVLSLCILFFHDFIEWRGVGVRIFLSKQNIVFRWGVYYFILFMIIINGKYGPGYAAADFIYKGF